MRAEYINPFIESTVEVFRTMLGCEVSRTGLTMHDSFCPEFDITGIIGLSGRAHGDVVISFEERVALAATETFLGSSYTEINDDVVDTVGELTNMIAGNAKTSLSSLSMSLALPTVIVGKNHSIRFPSKVKPVSLPFTTDWGRFNIEVGLIESPDGAHAVCV